jgi:hypothetical protein
MKKNDVVIYGKGIFLVTKVDKEYAYINKIRGDGLVMGLSQKIDKNLKVKKIEGARRMVKVDLPFKNINSIKYEDMISDAKKCVYRILTSKDTREVDSNKSYLKHLAFRSCMLPFGGQFKTLEDFSYRIGLKVTDKLYEFLAETIASDQIARSNNCTALSDRALSRVISNYQTHWASWYGFNKKLNEVLEKDYAIYNLEFVRRNSIQK